MKSDWFPYLTDVIFTSIFAYLIFDSAFVLWFNGYTARISLFGFLIPHASKILFWSSAALVWLRPRFGWRFGWALVLLYCAAELTTNWIYVPVHLFSNTGYLDTLIYGPHNYYFLLSNVFFVLAIYVSMIWMKGQFSLRFDWSILPFVGFIAVWISQGYITDSTLLVVNPLIEVYEFLWSVLYLNMAYGIFKPKQTELSLFQSFRS